MGRKFVVLARIPDKNNNIVDNPSQHFMLIENLRVKNRDQFTSEEIEVNLLPG